MNTEKERQPVEPEAQPLQEEELNEVNGGYPRQNPMFSQKRCPKCGQYFRIVYFDEHEKICQGKQ